MVVNPAALLLSEAFYLLNQCNDKYIINYGNMCICVQVHIKYFTFLFFN